MIAFYNYYDMGCAKTSAESNTALGAWHISPGQSSAMHALFEWLVSFCKRRASSDWTRGRKTPYQALQSLETSKVVA
eukprot:9152983-Heterocapsa_arctica.AAC.1